MKRYDLITPEGTRDLLFEDCLARRKAEKALSELFEGFGYSEVVTPGIEFYDAFMGSARNFRQESLYKLTDSKGRLMVLRPDCTIPIARLAATRLKEEQTPLRLYYIQSVFTNNALLKGRSDEVVQAGIELIGGENEKRADLEVLCTAVEALAAFDKDNFRLEIGHIGYFKELVAQLDLEDNVVEEIRMLISTKNYPALNDLLDEIGSNNITKALKQLPSLFGGIEVLDKASEIYTNDKITGILHNLKKIFGRLSSMGYEGKISVDLGIVSHMDYYTGVVFKGYLSEIGDSVLKGGRYDKLISSFGKDMPAIGFGIKVDLVARHLKKKGELPEVKPVDAVIFGEKGYVVEAMMYARELIAKGLKVEHSLYNTYEDTVAFAKAKGVKKIITVGEKITENDI